MAGSIPTRLAQFREVWVMDTEYIARDGERPIPVCVVARELHTGATHRHWIDELKEMRTPAYGLGDDCLLVAYSCVGDLQVHLGLRWDLPARVVDLHAEFRHWANGRSHIVRHGLLDALNAFGLGGMSATEKNDTRDLIIGGGPWSAAERDLIIRYCEEDVKATTALLVKMIDRIDLQRALIRGRYLRSLALVEWHGVPIDQELHQRIGINREAIMAGLIREVDSAFGVYDGDRFNKQRFSAYLARHAIPWPKNKSGNLILDRDTFKEQAEIYPQLAPLHALRRSLSALKKNSLAVGHDGRNRAYLAPFGSRTGRNQPSTSESIFGLPSWWRGLIQPLPGYGVAYLDWDQQEFGIAAALSGDPAMMDAYRSGDPYLAFAKQAGAVPHDATKASHPLERDRFKQCVLAVQYGMGAVSLGLRLKISPAHADQLLRMHRQTYNKFWSWSDATHETALVRGWIETVFGWRQRLTTDINERSVRNFPMQANGAEMMRIAVAMAIEAGIELCMPVHDALLIHAPLEALGDQVEKLSSIMEEASQIVLGGFRLRSGQTIIRHPDRFIEGRGQVMWDLVQGILNDAE
jgi:DNA polymerase I